MKCFNTFFQSAVTARREGDKNPNSSVVVETMKLLANKYFGYQIMDRSRQTVKKYLSKEKTPGAINNKMFKRLGYINDQLYEVQLVKSEIEHKDPINVGLSLLQYAKLSLRELYYNLFDKYSDVTMFEELEMDTKLLYLSLSDDNLYYSIRPAMKKEWKSLRSGDCTDAFSANSKKNSSLVLAALSI